MILDIPFVKNPGNQCGQACVLMILKYFYPEKKINFDNINKVIKFKPNKFTFPHQLAIALNHFGVKAKAFSKEDCHTGKRGIENFKKWFGKDFDEVFNQWVDYPVYEWTVRKAKKNGWFKIKSTPFTEIEKLFRKGYLVIGVADWNYLHGVKNKPYHGLSFVATGFDKKYAYINNPDEGKNLKYLKKLLKEAYNHPAISDDICVVYGKI